MASANPGETAMTRPRVLVAGLVVLLGVWCQSQGAALAEDTEMIVNGTPAPEGKYPWQVRIYSSMEDERGFCGGGPIAPPTGVPPRPAPRPGGAPRGGR